MEKLECAIANEQARQEARKAAGKVKPLPELDEETCLLIVAVENDDDITMIDLTINSTPSTLPTSPTSIAQSTAFILHQPKIIFNQHARHQTKQYVQHLPLQHHPIILHHDVYATMQSRYEFCLNIRDAKFLARQDIFLKRSPPTSEDETSDDNKHPKSKIISDTDTSSSGSRRTSASFYCWQKML
ncbi:unnamed protein product [Rhizophagus irregularis]|nr:unnamed protein product [Rhizophagus irregularis]CAB5371684.1 unnamed protein product [Rhizophagus irregularis]